MMHSSRRDILKLIAGGALAAGGAFYYYDSSNDTTGAFMGFACFPGFVGLAYLIIYFLTRDKSRG